MNKTATIIMCSWQRYELLWTQLRQRGYAGKPLDPSELNSLVFAVLAPDTPFDIWIDDVAFTRP